MHTWTMVLFISCGLMSCEEELTPVRVRRGVGSRDVSSPVARWAKAPDKVLTVRHSANFTRRVLLHVWDGAVLPAVLRRRFNASLHLMV